MYFLYESIYSNVTSVTNIIFIDNQRGKFITYKPPE